MKKPTVESTVLIFIAIISLVAFIAPSFFKFSANYTEKEQGEDIKQQTELRLMDKEKREILSEYNKKNQVLISDTRNQIDSLLKSYLQEGYIGIDNLTKEIKLPKTMMYICYLQSYDMFKKTQKADLFLAEIFNKNIKQLKTHEACERLLTDLEVKLRENNTNLQIELGALLEKHKGLPVSLNLKELNRATNQFIVDGKRMGFLSGSIALGIIGEGIFIKSNISAIKALTRKIACRMSVSTSFIIADGPLPIGDIIALLGWGVCAYDIYELTIFVPGKIKKDLTKSLENDYMNLSKHINHVIESLEQNFKLN